MTVSVWIPSLPTVMERLSERDAQYKHLSAYCLSRCSLYWAIWAFAARRSSVSSRNSSLCRTQTSHLAWDDSDRIPSRSPNDSAQTCAAKTQGNSPDQCHPHLQPSVKRHMALQSLKAARHLCKELEAHRFLGISRIHLMIVRESSGR